MNEKLIEKYARTIALVGANIESGEEVVIYSSVETYGFAKVLAEQCYRAGASSVRVDWRYDELTKLDCEFQTEKEFCKIYPWQTAKMRYRAEKHHIRIYIDSEDPSSLDGIDRKKYEKAISARYKKFKKYTDAAQGMEKWVVAAYPSLTWAKTVFPDDNEETAMEKLLSAILESVRVSEDNDSVAAWKEHDRLLHERCARLNKYKFDYLEYKSANGTDFRVWLIPETRWCGGGEYTKTGKYFSANIPTEEIFISPKAGKAEGKLVSTMPLSYNGQLIDKFSVTFTDGKVSDFSAEVGYDQLKAMIESDDGARMLGEVALVPKGNGIARQGILFYSTLFDENASCHVALGEGYIDTVENYAQRTLEECRALGINESRIHVDFMIGADDLSITGYMKDGKSVKIFENGTFTKEFE